MPRKMNSCLNARSLRSDCFHLDAQCYFHFEAVSLTDSNAEIRSIEHTKRVRTA